MSTVFNAGDVTQSPQAGLLAQQVFFPIAAVFAAVAPWLLLISLSGKFGLIVDVPTHARGMLFGFVGALIAGYLVGKQRRGYMLTLVALWLADLQAAFAPRRPQGTGRGVSVAGNRTDGF